VLLTIKLNYENIIGLLDDPKSLEKDSIGKYSLPENLNSSIELSKKNNPNLIIAQLEYEQAQKDNIIAKSDLAPTANLSLERSYTDDLSSTIDEREKDTIKASVSWPFYSGGKNIASLKKYKSVETRTRLILDSVTKQNQTNVASAWSNFQSNKSLLNSVQAQVRAAEFANEGITAEYNSGAGRTTLEVIQSNSLLLNAQISLANSERNFILSQFNLLKSIGLLNSEHLNIQ
jgi:outer membrane protein